MIAIDFMRSPSVFGWRRCRAGDIHATPGNKTGLRSYSKRNDRGNCRARNDGDAVMTG